MREGILKAVANPPKILWGPFLPVLVNMAIQFPLMFMFMGVGGVNPLLFMITLLIGHVAAVIAGAREPHISSMIQAFGPASKKTNNLYYVKGNKFAT